MTKNLIRLSKSCLSSSEKKAVNLVLKKEFLGMGTQVMKFEKELTKFFNREVVCVNSGTAALHLSLQSCGIKKGDGVLVPSITYVASYQAISATGAKPISCDINKENLLISLKDAERRITKKTKAIMPVHFAGHVGNLNQIYKFAKKFKLRVIEDAAHAFGTVYMKKRIGSFGDIICFSFDGIKNITSGEGGCVVSKDKKLLTKIKDARLLGVVNDTNKRFGGKRSWSFDVKDQGWRYHMSEINAAIGLTQLKRFRKLSSKRKTICKIYDKILLKNKKIHVFKRNYIEEVPHIYVVRIKNLVKRSLLRKDLLKKGIQTGLHYFPNHKLSKYKEKNSRKLYNAEKVSAEIITLPLHPDLSKTKIFFITKTLNELLVKGKYF